MENEPRIQDLTREVESLRLRVQQLESRYEVAPHMPGTSLISDKFLTRAFAVFGHNFVASLIISLPFYILFFIIVMIFGSNLY